MIQNEKPRVIVKNKNLQFIFDYCLETKTPFTANPRLSGDEWEIEFKISDIMGAVALGMFLRENRIEPIGVQVAKPQAAAVANATAAAKTKATKTAKKQDTPEITEPAFAAAATTPEPAAHETFNPAPAPAPVADTIFDEDSAEPVALAAGTESGGFSPEMLFDEN